jgi:hypothetical protein
LNAEHRNKIRECLDRLEAAQNLVNAAAQSLCSVPGFADEWSALSEPHDCIELFWLKIDHRRVELLEREKETDDDDGPRA